MFSGWKGGGAEGYGASGFMYMKGEGASGFMYMKGSEGSEGKDTPLKAGVLSCAEIPCGGLGGCLSLGPFPFPLGGVAFMFSRGVFTPPQT